MSTLRNTTSLLVSSYDLTISLNILSCDYFRVRSLSVLSWWTATAFIVMRECMVLGARARFLCYIRILSSRLPPCLRVGCSGCSTRRVSPPRPIPKWAAASAGAISEIVQNSVLMIPDFIEFLTNSVTPESKIHLLFVMTKVVLVGHDVHLNHSL